ncbi:MAG: crotonase/enoyl-CoA hydratase family protein [Burkholderiaceae bacterium]
MTDLRIRETNDAYKFKQIDIEYDPEVSAIWTYMKPFGIACFNLELLNELQTCDALFQKYNGQFTVGSQVHPVNYHVLASRGDNVFSLGGDLALFITLIKSRDREALLSYAKTCIDVIHNRTRNYHADVTTISLIQGDALGGGFECALSSNVIIAEESAVVGFPEILFNLFPGMGAYSFLARRIGAKKAEEMILSGKIYEVGKLHEMGLIDVLVPTGQGENAVYDFIRKNSRRLNGMRAMYECRRHTNPISYAELMNITEVWVDAALRLKEKDLNMMHRIVLHQMRRVASIQ